MAHFNEMALFLQKIREPGDGDDAKDAIVEVRYSGVGKEEKGMLEVPLVPEVDGLDVVDVVLHQSATKAYRMGEIYDRWFSSCFGYQVGSPVCLCLIFFNRDKESAEFLTYLI